MLRYYREQYRELVKRLATRIVDLAENFPLRHSTVLSPTEMPTPETEPAFVVAVLAPERPASTPEPSQAAIYGDSPTAWRPFAGQQALPAANYVASTAERLGLPTTVGDVNAAAELLRRYPAVLLIDPWLLKEPEGEAAALAVVRSLRSLPWVVPLIVFDENAPQPDDSAAEPGIGAQLATRMTAMLADGGVANPKTVGRLRDFVDVMPALVTKARQRFLKRGPISVPPGSPPPRRRLSDSDG
jgi:FxsC-like protein